MLELFTIENISTLLVLTLLQAVLGFDNLLYISIESKRAPETKRRLVRRLGISLAIILRIALLFAVTKAITYFQNPIFSLQHKDIIETQVNLHSLIVLFGGIFIIYTATKEILHMLTVEDLEHEGKGQKHSFAKVLFWIILMNLIFSFDSILSAIALTKVFSVMAISIIISGTLMIVLSDKVAQFLQKNRSYEVLGLFILFIVGIMLLSEGGHLAHLKLFNYPVTPMTKTTFYFVIGTLVLIDIVQSVYMRKLGKGSLK